MSVNQCEKCGKVFPHGKNARDLVKFQWEGRHQVVIVTELCPACTKLAVADWQPKQC